MAAQAGEIILIQKLGIADLHRVPEFRRQVRQERVEPIQKLTQVREAPPAKSSELENQQRRLLAVRRQRPQKHLAQRAAIEEAFVVFTGLLSVARMRWKYLARYLLRHLERKPKAFRRLVKQLPPELLAGKLVKSEIAAHRGKRFGVLVETLGVEPSARTTAARKRAVARIDLPQPAFVFPGATADIDRFGGQRSQARGQAGAVECARLFE